MRQRRRELCQIQALHHRSRPRRKPGDTTRFQVFYQPKIPDREDTPGVRWNGIALVPALTSHGQDPAGSLELIGPSRETSATIQPWGLVLFARSLRLRQEQLDGRVS